MLKSINILKKKHKNFKNRVLKMIFVTIEVEINLADFIWIYSKQIAISKIFTRNFTKIFVCGFC
ncbi:hypothetical protein CQA40_04065 [Helicobacter sp. MIT 01-3238]|nr:hypothetical protein CQA40_04065 [Helicobacter sp. MIT 01-3238]